MAIRKFNMVVSLLLLFFTTGCSQNFQSYPIPDKDFSSSTKCRIYVILPPQMVGVAVIDMIIDGDTYIGTLGSGQYLYWEGQPGQHSIIVTPKFLKIAALVPEEQARFELNAEAKQVYYLQIHRGLLNRTVEMLEPEKGKKLLAKCKAPIMEKNISIKLTSD